MLVSKCIFKLIVLAIAVSSCGKTAKKARITDGKLASAGDEDVHEVEYEARTSISPSPAPISTDPSPSSSIGAINAATMGPSPSPSPNNSPSFTIIDNDELGYSQNCGTLWDYLSDAPAWYGTTVRVNFDSSRGCVFKWTFRNLRPGPYKVAVMWSAFFDRTTTAPYSIDGGAAVLVNQKLNPQGLAADGHEWQVIASSHVVTGSVLMVELRDTGPGTTVADAVRIERID